MQRASFLDRSKFGAAVDLDRVVGDPTGGVGSEEGEDLPDGQPNALQSLDAKHVAAPLLGFGEARHVCVDDAGRDRVHPDAPRFSLPYGQRRRNTTRPLRDALARDLADFAGAVAGKRFASWEARMLFRRLRLLAGTGRRDQSADAAYVLDLLERGRSRFRPETSIGFIRGTASAVGPSRLLPRPAAGDFAGVFIRGFEDRRGESGAHVQHAMLQIAKAVLYPWGD